MKKTLLFLGAAVGLLLPKMSMAQSGVTFPYTYATSINAYVPLDSTASVILGSTAWDDTTVAFTLPFAFKLIDSTTTHLTLDANGGIDYLSDFEFPKIMCFHSDYIDRGNSQVLLKTTGIAPSRIAKIEYKNVGFYNDNDSIVVDSANFQLWLYEGSNKIEYRAGGSYTPNVDFSFDSGDPMFIGLIYTDEGLVGSTNDTCHVIGNVNNAPKDSIMAFNVDNATQAQTDFINYGKFVDSGRVFTFTPPVTPVSVSNVRKEIALNLYPNPTKQNIVLSLGEMPSKNATFKVMDIAGKVLSTQVIENKITTIDLSGVAAGFYYGSFDDEKHTAKTRFVKQ
jgi:hypothetical protein